ncbi:YfjI family protein [Dyella agri]|uniref:DUF3987 domain-containing protein n=1 Tax=Dyella agri TaxID=1926869 RepID=A0ABW8KEA2_9GAMM
MFQNNPNAYPIASLTPNLSKAALELADIVACTDIIAGTSILNAANVAICGKASWKHPATGKFHPSTLYSMIFAVSGDRKTTADNLACSPIYEEETQNILKHAESIKAFKSAHTTWSSIHAGLKNRIKKLTREGKDTTDAEAEAEAHAALEPNEPRLRRLIRQDITKRAIYEALEGDGATAAFMVDEGQILLEGDIMRHLGVLNKIWDGAAILTYDRAKHDTIIVRNPRACISIMVQPTVFNKFLQRHGAITHGSGHFARYLFARSPSIQGYRHTNAINTGLIDLVPFHHRITALLQLDAGEVAPMQHALLEFDEQAKIEWFQIAYKVEADLKPGSFLSDIGDFASKYMDIVGRIATTMHVFDDVPGKISVDTLLRAEAIACWHLNEYKAIFSTEMQRSEESIDAEAVYGYLYSRYYRRNMNSVSKNYVRQRCGVRGERYYRALDELIMMRAIEIQRSQNNTQIIVFNPQFFYENPI